VWTGGGTPQTSTFGWLTLCGAVTQTWLRACYHAYSTGPCKERHQTTQNIHHAHYTSALSPHSPVCQSSVLLQSHHICRPIRSSQNEHNHSTNTVVVVKFARGLARAEVDLLAYLLRPSASCSDSIQLSGKEHGRHDPADQRTPKTILSEQHES
jgi:hypothetical protein